MQEEPPIPTNVLTGTVPSASLKQALAIAIVKSKKELQQGGQQWKRKAIAYQRELKRCRSALEQLSKSQLAASTDTHELLQSLPDIGEDIAADHRIDYEQRCRTEGMKESALRLGCFLRNVHAMRFAQVGVDLMFSE